VIASLHEAQPRFRDVETLVETFVLNIMNKYIKPAFMRCSSEMNVGNGKSKTSIRTTTRPSMARKYELPSEDTSWRVDIEPAARVIEWMVCRMRVSGIRFIKMTNSKNRRIYLRKELPSLPNNSLRK